MEEVLQFLNEVQTFYIATTEGDQPRVRPFGATTVFENKLYFVTSNTKDVFKQIIANPKIEICGMNTKYQWLRVKAAAVIDPSREAKAKMLNDCPVLQQMYKLDDGLMEVFYIKDVTATYSSFTEAPRTVQF